MAAWAGVRADGTAAVGRDEVVDGGGSAARGGGFWAYIRVYGMPLHGTE